MAHKQRSPRPSKQTAPVADPRPQERGADALVEAHPASHLADVGADLLADVGDLVDEGDLGRQEGVGGELDHLGAGDVGADDLAAERLVQRGDRVAGRLVAGSAPTTTRSGCMKSSTAEPSLRNSGQET